MVKRLKPKKTFWLLLVVIILLPILIYTSNKLYKNYQYKQTYEYKLIEHGYSKENAILLLNNLKTNKEKEYFLNKEVNLDYIKLLKEKYFISKHYFTYLEYMDNNPTIPLNEVVRNINVHLDKDFYSLNLKTDTSKDYLMIVNKYYLLDEEYIPEDLVIIPQTYSWGAYGTNKLRQIAFDAYKEMWQEANKDGYYLMINSSFRSYQEQKELYNNIKNKQGEVYANEMAAREGSSEHETGLALDIFSKSNTNSKTFENTDEAKWLANNAYRFGFILRYPKDKTNITGYKYESWHYRYIGKKAAKYCYENNITYEEYYAYFVEK